MMFIKSTIEITCFQSQKLWIAKKKFGFIKEPVNFLKQLK